MISVVVVGVKEFRKVYALSERIYGTSITRDEYDFPISQEEKTREYILLNIIHKKVIAKGNFSSSSDDIDEEAPQSKDDIILSGGDLENDLTSSTSLRNICIICCDNYEEGDDALTRIRAVEVHDEREFSSLVLLLQL